MPRCVRTRVLSRRSSARMRRALVRPAPVRPSSNQERTAHIRVLAPLAERQGQEFALSSLPHASPPMQTEILENVDLQTVESELQLAYLLAGLSISNSSVGGPLWAYDPALPQHANSSDPAKRCAEHGWGWGR